MPWIDGGSGFFRAKAVPSGLLPLSIGGIAALYGCGYFIAFLRRLSMACLLRPLFTEGLPYNKSNRTKGGRGRDGCLCGQRVCPERGDGLPAAVGNGKTGGRSPPAKAIPGGSAGGRGLCCGGVSAGMGLFGGSAGKTGRRRAAGPGRLWRRGAVFAADAAAFRRIQRHGRLCTGPGTAGGRRRTHGKRRVLHGCGRKGSADLHRGGLSGIGGGIPCLRQAWRERPAAACAHRRERADCRPDGAVGHRQCPAGARKRNAGAGGGSRRVGSAVAGGGAAAAVAGGPAVSGGCSGEAPADGAGTAPPAHSLSRGGDAVRTAAGGAYGLGRGGRDAVSRPDGGPVAHGVG